MAAASLRRDPRDGKDGDRDTGGEQKPEYDGQPARLSEKAGDIGDGVRVHRATGMLRRVSSAIRAKVSAIRQLAFSVPARLPETLETPPARRRWATGSSMMRNPIRAARICISRF